MMSQVIESTWIKNKSVTWQVSSIRISSDTAIY